MSCSLRIAWEEIGPEAARGVLWKRVAYAMRYAKAGTFTEFWTMPNEALELLNCALAEIVDEENRANAPKGK